MSAETFEKLKLTLSGALLGACVSWLVLTMVQDRRSGEQLVELKTQLATQSEAIEEVQADVSGKLNYVSDRMTDLQARMQRIDALGEHLTYVAGIEEGEFDFKAPVPSGGPALQDDSEQPSLAVHEIEQLLEELDSTLRYRQTQLTLLANEIQYLEQHKQNRITGKPVRSGWLSSRYGYRSDPFTGKKAWHNGVDFAGKLGSDIVAVAGGVVTRAGRQSGYGYFVEISHADGYITRYAHNKKNLVVQGEVVEKGQKIATMGSTGRSTGPHVHFEVLKNGKSYDPARYLRRASL